jgi:hypothetical protein
MFIKFDLLVEIDPESPRLGVDLFKSTLVEHYRSEIFQQVKLIPDIRRVVVLGPSGLKENKPATL